MRPYDLPLKVASPEGDTVVAKVKQIDAFKNVIAIPHMEIVEKDDPEFSKKGVISIVYLRKNHREIVTKITKYLEDLFIVEMKNEGNNSKHSGKTNSRGSKAVVDAGTTPKGQGKESGSIHNSRGGHVPTPSNKRGKPEAIVAKDSNKKDSGDA